MEHHYGGLNWRVLIFVLLLMTLALADENHFESSDDITSDITTDTSITFTERDEFPGDVQTANETFVMHVIEMTTTYVCQTPADPGPCIGELIKFFYDSTARRCRQFIYGGCDGNENNFVTEADCLQTCAHALVGQPFRDNDTNDFPTDSSLSVSDKDEVLTLANGHGETSFTFATEYPFIQLKAVDISEFKLR